MTDWKVIEGDCVEVMVRMPECSVDSVVCDPPYGLEFMGKEWDSLKTYAGGNPNIKPHGQAVASPLGFALDAAPHATPGYRKKNPRCRRCGKLQRGNGSCKCPAGGDWSYRHDESGFQMQSWHERWAREALRVLKPGGFLLAFGGTRTYHRLVCAVEDAGFEIRDTIAWLYGSGFPKSLDVSKAIDKAAVTPEAERWQGWGTALKPAHEPIVVARKPLVGTVARNVLEFGTGALNVDGCRIGHDEPVKTVERTAARFKASEDDGVRFSGSVPERSTVASADPLGRWPANTVLSHSPGCRQVGTRRVKTSAITKPYARQNTGGFSGPLPVEASMVDHADADGLEEVAAWECEPGCAVRMLDEQSGDMRDGVAVQRNAGGQAIFGGIAGGENGVGARPDAGYGGSGGASRFFPTFAADDSRMRYVAKSSSAERSAGLDGGVIGGGRRNVHPLADRETY